MKSALIIASLVIFCVSATMAQRVECTRGGCAKYDAYGNGISCTSSGCGPVRNFGNSRYRRNPDYVTTGNAKCGAFGCVSDPDPNARHTPYGSSSGNSRCGPEGCSTNPDSNARHNAYGSSSGDSHCDSNGCYTGKKKCSWYQLWC